MVYVISDSKLYQLIGGLSNVDWKEFKSSSDKITLKENYTLVGSKDGYSYASPVLIDIKYDIIDLQRNVDNFTALKKLDYNRIWIGDQDNEPIAKSQIGVLNLPTLGAANFPYPSFIDLPAIPMPNPTFNPLSGFDWLMSGPWLPQIYCASVNTTNTSSETIISSALAMTQIKAAQSIKRLDVGSFIVKSRNINFTWDNPAMLGIPEAIKQLYGLETNYTFTNAQALDELGEGLLKNSVNGTLSLATLTKNKIWKGDVNNKPIEVDMPSGVTNATYIIQTPNENLPDSQALSILGGGILKSNSNGVVSIASGGNIPELNDYVTPTGLQEEILIINTELQSQIAAITGYGSLALLTEFLANLGWTTGYSEYLWSKYRPLRTYNKYSDTDVYSKDGGNVWYDANHIGAAGTFKPGLRITSWDSSTVFASDLFPVSMGLFGFRNSLGYVSAQEGFVWQSYMENDSSNLNYRFPKNFGMYAVGHDEGQIGWNRKETLLMEYKYYDDRFNFEKSVNLKGSVLISSLNSGILKVTNGLVSLAVADIDYATSATLEAIKVETEGYRDEALTFKNDAYISSVNAETSEAAALTYKLDAEASAQSADQDANAAYMTYQQVLDLFNNFINNQMTTSYANIKISSAFDPNNTTPKFQNFETYYPAESTNTNPKLGTNYAIIDSAFPNTDNYSRLWGILAEMGTETSINSTLKFTFNHKLLANQIVPFALQITGTVIPGAYTSLLNIYANINLNNNKITGITTTEEGTCAVNRDYLVQYVTDHIPVLDITLTGAVTGVLSNKIINTTLTPINTSQITDFSTAAITAAKTVRLNEFVVPNAFVNMNNQKLSSLANGTIGTDAVNLNQLTSATYPSTSITDFTSAAITAAKTVKLNEFSLASGNINLNNYKITGSATPDGTVNSELATVGFVKSSIPTISLNGAVSGTINSSGVIATTLNQVLNLPGSYINFIWADLEQYDSPYMLYNFLPNNNPAPIYSIVSQTGTFGSQRKWFMDFKHGTSSAIESEFALSFYHSSLPGTHILNPFKINYSATDSKSKITVDGILDVNNNLIRNVTAGTLSTDAVNLGQTSSLIASATYPSSSITDFSTAAIAAAKTVRLDQFVAPTASVSMNGQKITNLSAGISATDAVNLLQTSSLIASATYPSSSITDFTSAAITAAKTVRLDQFAVPTASVSMNGQFLLNVATAIRASDAVPYSQLTSTVNNATYPSTSITDFTSAAITAAKTVRLDQFAIPTASVSMNSQKITLLANPVLSTDGVNKSYVDTRTINELSAPITSFSMNNNRITNTSNPVSGQDVATKSYVDGLSSPVWTSYTCNIYTTGGTAAAPSGTITAYYSIVGKTMFIEIRGPITFGYSGQSGFYYYFNIPSGFTVNKTITSSVTSFTTTTYNSSILSPVGNGYTYYSSAARRMTNHIIDGTITSGRGDSLLAWFDSGGGYIGGANVPDNSTFYFCFTVRIPIN